MNSIIEYFELKNLHGNKTIKISIENNQLILVGENGSGKTTVIACMFYFLTGQWRRLLKYKFSEISMKLNEENLSVSRNDIQKFYEVDPRLNISPGAQQYAADKLRKRGVPITASRIRRFIEREMSPYAREELSNQAQLFGENADSSKFQSIRKIHRKIKKEFGSHVLYLPTYRRIEQELKSIFPDSEIEDMIPRSLSGRLRDPDINYIELVQFGMEDVEGNIKRTLENLREFFRSSLYMLMLNYLNEIIQGNYKTQSIEFITDDAFDAISSVLGHIDDALLPQSQKDKLQDTLRTIRDKGASSVEQKVIGHFFTKLLELYREQQSRQERITQFVAICNSYLSGKYFEYDATTINLTLSVGGKHKKKEELEISSLSSGEKQIVSLFSHLLLSADRRFFVLIDEPELSLSVEWQKRFLPDILSTGVCDGLIAVTHSPFIFDNDFDRSARSIDEFIYSEEV